MSFVTRQEAGLVLVAINAVFADRFPLPTGKDDASKARKQVMIDTWHALLKDLPQGIALAATQSVLTEAVHPPRPGEIRTRALAKQLEAPSGADAWGEVCRAIGRWGRYRYSKAQSGFSSPAIALSVQAIGGWSSICSSDNEVADRSQFIRHFDGQMQRAQQRVQTGASKSIASAISERQERIEGPSLVSGFLGGGE